MLPPPETILVLQVEERPAMCTLSSGNVQYRPYLTSALAGFHREHVDSYNEHDAARYFLEVYCWLAEFEDGHLEKKTSKQEVKMYTRQNVLPLIAPSLL